MKAADVRNRKQESHFRRCLRICVSFVLSAWGTQPTPPTVFESLLGSDLSTMHHNGRVTQSSSREGGGNLMRGAHEVICDVLCSLELLRYPPQESQLIILSTPYGRILMSRGPTQLYSMFLSTGDVEEFLVNLSAKQAFA